MIDTTSRPALAAGLRHTARMTVEPRHTVPQVADWPGFADMPAVPATAMMVEARVELVEIQGKALLFKVECRDAAWLIGAGTQRRAIVDLRRFEERLAAKAAAL